MFAPILGESSLRRDIAARRLGTPMPWRSLGHVVAAWLAYGVLAWFSVGHGGVALIGAWVAMGFVLLGNGAIVHETLHGHLFPAAWANRAVGTIAGTSVGLPWSTYRAYHLAHHQAACTEDDPEGLPYVFATRWTYALIPIGGPMFAGQFVWWTVRTLVGSPPPFVRSSRQRRNAAIDGSIGIVFYGVAIAVGVADPGLLARVWLVPWLFAIVVLEPMVLIPEHYGAPTDLAPFALRTTRTVQSNRLLTWLYWSNNFHTAHHIAPGVVPQHLRAVSDELISPRLSDEWKSSGYLAFHSGLFRRLPWRSSRQEDPPT